MGQLVLTLFKIVIFSSLYVEIFCANEDDSPYAFLRFEPHELSKETFLKEQQLVAALKKYRETLANRRKLIKKFADNVRGRNAGNDDNRACDTITAYNVMKRSAVDLPSMKSQFQEDLVALPAFRSFVNQSMEEFPGPEDYNGAVKGLVMLHDTYELQLDQTFEGKVAYFSSQFLYKEFQGKEKLQVPML